MVLPPYSPKPRVRGDARTGSLRRCVAATAAVAACGGLIAGCGSSGSSSKKVYLDVARVERSIEQSILSERHLHSTVVCPTRVLQKPSNFACIATTFAAKKPHREIKTPFLVTITNTKGYVTYVGK